MPGCKSCEATKKRVQDVLKDFPSVQFGEIDSLEEPERIESLGVMTSGAIVIDGEVVFSSLPKEKVLRHKIEETMT
ncbi:thioredoxin family protein [Halobacillus amylolyticus]|uniref:Thioredoxin family protein n=1 Tax=Halobacillus amylolyticus TaxID=2932259 RepID=A0ABY4HBA6_9BACI|nr:thioredoxin family protein [Halobacillus amylolyticus]UOR12112.1 thioredoxin family protein [Halobacillus amylolyticus]